MPTLLCSICKKEITDFTRYLAIGYGFWQPQYELCALLRQARHRAFGKAWPQEFLRNRTTFTKTTTTRSATCQNRVDLLQSCRRDSLPLKDKQMHASQGYCQVNCPKRQSARSCGILRGCAPSLFIIVIAFPLRSSVIASGSTFASL